MSICIVKSVACRPAACVFQSVLIACNCQLAFGRWGTMPPPLPPPKAFKCPLATHPQAGPGPAPPPPPPPAPPLPARRSARSSLRKVDTGRRELARDLTALLVCKSCSPLWHLGWFTAQICVIAKKSSYGNILDRRIAAMGREDIRLAMEGHRPALKGDLAVV